MASVLRSVVRFLCDLAPAPALFWGTCEESKKESIHRQER